MERVERAIKPTPDYQNQHDQGTEKARRLEADVQIHQNSGEYRRARRHSPFAPAKGGIAGTPIPQAGARSGPSGR